MTLLAACGNDTHAATATATISSADRTDNPSDADRRFKAAADGSGICYIGDVSQITERPNLLCP